MTEKCLHFNNFSASLVNAISSADTSAELDDATGLVNPETDEYYYLTLFDEQAGDLEIVRVSALAGSVVTIARNQQGTTGPAGGWPIGAAVQYRLTADAIATIAGANKRLSKSSDLPGWVASDYPDAGHVVLTSGGKFMVCVVPGETGVVEPTGSGYLLDNECFWYAINDSYTTQDSLELGAGAMAIGRSCFTLGDLARALRYGAAAMGNGAVAGNNSAAQGPFAIAMDSSAAIGPQTFAGDSSFAGGDGARAVSGGVSIGPYAGAGNNAARREWGQILMGPGAYGGAKYGVNMTGHSTVPPFCGNYYGGASNDEKTAQQSANKMVITSVPVNLGDGPVWQADTVYEHGTVLFPTVTNGLCYVAYCRETFHEDAYFAPKTSGSVEPVWGTTPGGTTNDPNSTGIKWYAVDPTAMLLTMGDYSRFTPTAVGFICDEGASPGTQPIISFGIDGNNSKWLAATQTTKLTGPLSSELFAPTNTEGSKTLQAALVTAGTGNITGRLVIEGIALEVMSA
jgi:hypothetical protein